MFARAIQLKRFDAPSSCTLSSYRRFSAFKSQNPANQGIVDFLMQHKDEEDRKAKPNWFKVHAYNSAILTVSKIDTPIRSGEDLHAIPGIGARITERINDYLYKQYAQSASENDEAFQNAIRVKAKALFSTIPGVGPAKTRQLVEAGCLSIESLLSNEFSSYLNPIQLLHAKYLRNGNWLNKRRDADNILEFCRGTLGPGYELALVGEYRRGFDSFPAVHIIISHPDHVHVPLPTSPPLDTGIVKGRGKGFSLFPTQDRRRERWLSHPENIPETLLQSDVIPNLQRQYLIADPIQMSRTSWKGYILLPDENGDAGTSRQDRARAIEKKEGRFTTLIMQLVPQKSFASSLAFYTGDDMFNRYLRTSAQQQGMLFNEHGVWQWIANEKTPPVEPSNSSESSASEADSVSTQSQSPITQANSTDRANAVDTVNPVDAIATANNALAQSTQSNRSPPAEDGYWALQPSATEEEIFELLKIAYVKPEDRVGPGNWGMVKKNWKRPVSAHSESDDTHDDVHDDVPT